MWGCVQSYKSDLETTIGKWLSWKDGKSWGAETPVPSCAVLQLTVPAALLFNEVNVHRDANLGHWTQIILQALHPSNTKKNSNDFEPLIHLMIFYSLFSVHYWLCLLLVCSKGIQLHAGAESLQHLTVGLEINFRMLNMYLFTAFQWPANIQKGKMWNLNYPHPNGFCRQHMRESM